MADVDYIEHPDGTGEVIIRGHMLDRIKAHAEENNVSPQMVVIAAFEHFIGERLLTTEQAAEHMGITVAEMEQLMNEGKIHWTCSRCGEDGLVGPTENHVCKEPNHA